jgi:hypothetical protein
MARAGTAWRMAQFRPGGNPIRALAEALAKPGLLFDPPKRAPLSLSEIVDSNLRMSKLGLIDLYEQSRLDNVNLLLVVDQFEELFRYRKIGASFNRSDYGVDEEAIAFVNLLLEIAARPSWPIYVVLTMRSDFLGDCAQFYGLPEATNNGQYLVPRMSRDERRAAIANPAMVFGAQIAPVLLTRLVNDVGDNPDQLSILQHALNRTWAKWQEETGGNGPLEPPHYQAIGTMANALDKATEAEMISVVDVFREPSRSFLMPPAGEGITSEKFIDISHESLMRVWKRLKQWGDDEAQSAQMYRDLAAAAAKRKPRKGGLWRDPELQLALAWQKREKPNPTWAAQYRPEAEFASAMAFLQESKAAREREEKAKQRRAKRNLVIFAFTCLSCFWPPWPLHHFIFPQIKLDETQKKQVQ